MAGMGRVLALVDDLLFVSKIAETARHVGVEVRTVGTGAGLVAEAQAGSPALVIADLNARGGAIEAVGALRAAGCTAPVVGFLSHVQVDLAAKAQAAGFDQVLPRSKFTQQLAEILERAK
jgi:CheY-like chemotaxis protein